MAGNDFDLSNIPTELTFAPGVFDVTASAFLTVTDDNILENNETFVVSVVGTSLDSQRSDDDMDSITITIIDDDGK